MKVCGVIPTLFVHFFGGFYPYILFKCNSIQVVVRASLAQLLVFVELARCARSIQIEIKDLICM